MTLRIFLISFLLAFFILAEGYRGNLVSFLLRPGYENAIESVEEAANAPQPIKSLSNIAKAQLINDPDPILQKLNSKYEVHRNLDLGLLEVAEEKALRIESQQMLRYRIKQDFTNPKTGLSPLHISKACLMYFNVVIYARRNAMTTPAVGKVITALKESGIVEKILLDKVGKTEKLEQNETFAIALANLQGVFLILAVILALSLIAFFVERLA